MSEPQDLLITMSSLLSNSVAKSTITLEESISQMKLSGMDVNEIKSVLMNDLNNGGRIFGSYRNAIKNTTKNGVGYNSNIASQKVYQDSSVKEFQWVGISDKRVCEDCEDRHGQTGTMEYFRTVGLPRSGFSICQTNCRCQLVPMNYKGENIEEPILIKESKDKSIKKYWAGIGVSSQKLIKDYTADSSVFNYKLRRNPTLIKTNKDIQEIQKLLKESPKYKKTAYRGLSFDSSKDISNFMKDIEEGGILTSKSFWSSSSSFDIANGFSRPLDTGYRAMLKIKSKSGVNIKDISVFPEEKEVLFPHQSVFKVKKINIDEGVDTVYNIELEEIVQ
jgi:hypothetical protein